MSDLRKVLECLSKNQLYIRHEKCMWCCKYVKYVGAILDNGVLSMNPSMIEAILNWEIPKNIIELRGFLGVCNYLKQWYKTYGER